MDADPLYPTQGLTRCFLRKNDPDPSALQRQLALAVGRNPDCSTQ